MITDDHIIKMRQMLSNVLKHLTTMSIERHAKTGEHNVMFPIAQYQGALQVAKFYGTAPGNMQVLLNEIDYLRNQVRLVMQKLGQRDNVSSEQIADVLIILEEGLQGNPPDLADNTSQNDEIIA